MIIDDNQMRHNLDRLVGRRVTDEMWATLKQKQLLQRVDDYESGHALSLGDVAEFVKERLREAGMMLPESGEALEFVTRGREKRDLRGDLRNEAVSLLLAQVAAEDRAVQTFRNRHLGGTLIPWDQVAAWIERQAAKDGKVSVWRPVDAPHYRGSEVKVVQYAVPGSQYAMSKAVSAGGVLDHLRGVGQALSNGLGWKFAEAVMFVLTGEVPLVRPIHVEETMRFPVHAASRISMQIDPTKTPQEVAEVYKKHREHFSGKGRRQRKLEEKSLRLAMFSTTRPKDEPLKKAMRAWNRMYPSWKYTEPTNFGRDIAAVRRRLLQPLKGDLVKDR